MARLKHNCNHDRRNSAMGHQAPADYGRHCTHTLETNDAQTQDLATGAGQISIDDSPLAGHQVCALRLDVVEIDARDFVASNVRFDVNDVIVEEHYVAALGVQGTGVFNSMQVKGLDEVGQVLS